MAEDNFYIINSWMIDELNLSGIELQVFAIIWSLSRGEKQMYIAGNAHLVRMTKKSEPTIIAALKKLCEKKLIEKIPVVVNKVDRNYYKAINQGTKESLGGYLKNLSGGTKEILAPNNKEIYKENNKENKRLSNDNPKVEFSEEFEHFWELYDYKKGKQKAYAKWNKLSDADKQKAIDAIPAYKEDCARYKRDMQHPATYLYNHTFEDDFTTRPKVSFYDVLPTDSEQEKKFKNWMRTSYPNIENTALPLSFGDFMSLYTDFGTEEIKNQLEVINANIGKYKYSDINAVIRGYLEDI